MFYSDKPIASNNEDLLNRGNFAKLLANTLINLDTKETFTVGLFGKWGSGKTSIVNMTLAEIEQLQSTKEEKDKMLVVHFEPWNFSNSDQLLTQFFVRLANEFQSKGDESLNKIGKALENYSDAFSLLEFIPAVGTPIAAATKLAASSLGKVMQNDLDERDVLKQKDYVIQLLNKQENRILVVLDDIDRLSNEQIRYIFQLITSVAKFPNTTYLLIFDKEIVVEALKGVQSGNGQDYLEKVIQMPIQIPNIRRGDLRNVLFKRLNDLLSDFSEISFSEKHWQQIYKACVDPFITHLRDINRLCNALRFKLTGISSEVNFADMVAISILEIHHPLVYEWVTNNKSILTGEHDYSSIDNRKSPKEWLTFYSEDLERLVIKERQDALTPYTTTQVVKFLSVLFPYFGKRVGMTFESLDATHLRKHNQIAHPDKFERYFDLDIDSMAYRTADVQNVVYHFESKEITEYLMFHESNGTCYEFLEDVRANISEINEERAKILIQALCKSAPYLNKSKDNSWLSLNANNLAQYITLDLFDRIPTDNRMNYLIDTITSADMDILQTISTVINMVELAYGRLAANGREREFSKIITLDELLHVETTFTSRIKEVLSTNSLFGFTEWRIVYHLLESFDPEYTKDYLQKLFSEDINILRFLENYISTWIGSGKSFEIQNTYDVHFTTDHVLKAIDNCRNNGSFFTLPYELQQKCASFSLFFSGHTQYNDHIPEHDADNLISKWKQSS